MRLSTRGQYGLRAMCVLGIKYGEGNIPLRLIADQENISLQYLEQIFRQLRRAGLVESARGAKGGYHLARDPVDITVGDVVRTLEGPIAPVECLSGGEECSRQDECLTREAWYRLQQSMKEALDGITLGYLCRGKPADQRRDKEKKHESRR